MIITPGDAIREREVRELEQMQKVAAAAERTRLERIERWGRALSVLPEDELIGLAQRWSSLTDAVVPAAERAIEFQKGR